MIKTKMNPKISEEDKVKSNLKNILFKDQKVYCCLCLESVRNCFFNLDFTFTSLEADPCTLENMMLVIFNEQDLSNLTTGYICDVCQASLKQAFSFVAEFRNTSKILNYYFDQLNGQIDAVHNQVKTTGIFANTVLLIHPYSQRLDKNYERKTVFEDVTTEDCNVAVDISDDDANDVYDANESIEDEAKPTETKQNLLICDICGKPFQYKSALKYHMTNTHRERSRMSRPKTKSDSKPKSNSKIIKRNSTNECPECPTTPCVHEKYIVAALGKRLQGLKFYKCKDCDYYTSSGKMYLINHVNKVHLDLHPHLCDTCGSSFPSVMSLKIHIKQYHSGRGVCEYCDKIIMKNLKLHIEGCMHIQRAHQCVSCPASFDSMGMLKRHEKSHQRLYNCRMCTMTFRHGTDLSSHKKTAHQYRPTPRSFKKLSNTKMIRSCEFCEKKFLSTRLLADHLTSAHKDQKYKCHICDREFDTRKQYQGHSKSAAHLIKENPNVDFTYKCTHCNFSCITKAILENHINVIHLDVKPYPCEICSKSFTTSVHLKNHMDRHAGIRNYKCKKCDVTCTNLSGLTKHVYRHHERKEDWPFSCDICSRKFVSSGEKNNHLKEVHAEERKARCPICDALFHTMGRVRTHVAKVHARGKGHAVAEFLKANKHNKELMELFRDRRKPHMENASNFTLTVAHAAAK